MSDLVDRLSDAELAELAAFADGSLPAERRPGVEARVAASPELQELVDRQARAVAATRSLQGEPVPASLEAAVAAERRRREPRRRPRRAIPRVALAGALVAVVATVAAAVLTGGPGAPTVAEAARFAAEPATAPAPEPIVDGTRLDAEVEGVVFPDLRRAFGWSAEGLNRGRVDGRNATTVVYGRDGRRIAYAIVGGSGLPRPTEGERTTLDGVQYQTLRVDGRVVVTWRRGGHTCILVGDASPGELLALARY
jgi:anti-sigma factor RsiW